MLNDFPHSPLRVGTTSYILPEDLLPNVRFLAPRVDDIEVVLFESEQTSNLPSPQTVRELARLAGTHGLSYTIHFPLDVFPGSLDETVRRKSVESYQRIGSLTAPLHPFSYIFHLTPESYAREPATDIARWHSQLEKTIVELLESGWDPQQLCVETLSYRFEHVLDLVQKYHLAVTLDIGHIWLCGLDARYYTRLLLPNARVIHFHGVAGGHDHLGAGSTPREDRDDFLRAVWEQCGLDQKERVLTLEVFDPMYLKDSMQVVQDFLVRNPALVKQMDAIQEVC